MVAEVVLGFAPAAEKLVEQLPFVAVAAGGVAVLVVGAAAELRAPAAEPVVIVEHGASAAAAVHEGTLVAMIQEWLALDP